MHAAIVRVRTQFFSSGVKPMPWLDTVALTGPFSEAGDLHAMEHLPFSNRQLEPSNHYVP